MVAVPPYRRKRKTLKKGFGPRYLEFATPNPDN
jgi:hypothetical protein